jgi:hypothetical protein
MAAMVCQGLLQRLSSAFRPLPEEGREILGLVVEIEDFLFFRFFAGRPNRSAPTGCARHPLKIKIIAA